MAAQDEEPGPSGKTAVAAKKKKADDGDVATQESVDEEAHALECMVALAVGCPKLLMLDLVQRIAAATMIRSTPGTARFSVIPTNAALALPLGAPFSSVAMNQFQWGNVLLDDPGGRDAWWVGVCVVAGIDRCRVVAPERADKAPYCEAEGINFPGVWAHADLVDVDAITTNDVGAVMQTFGVEAARATLVREVVKVFGVYGIGVDVRHLGLIADFMTHQVRSMMSTVAAILACNHHEHKTLCQLFCLQGLSEHCMMQT